MTRRTTRWTLFVVIALMVSHLAGCTAEQTTPPATQRGLSGAAPAREIMPETQPVQEAPKPIDSAKATQPPTAPQPTTAPAATVAAQAAPVKPVQTPTTNPAPSKPIGVTITSITSPVSRNANARVSAQTAPGAQCSVTVIYKSGPSEAQGLYPKTADSQGNVSWTWKVGGNTTRGSWPVHITCNGASASTSFTVQ